MGTKIAKIMFLFVSITLLIGFASSVNWYFDQNEYNVQNISNESNSVFTSELKTISEDEVIRPEDIVNFTTQEGGEGENTFVMYEYSVINNSTGTSMRVNKTLDFHEGMDIWYAEFETNDTSMENLTLKASGEGQGGLPDSQGVVEQNFSMDVNDERPELLDVNLDYDFTDPIKADREFKPDVQVINSSNGNVLGENDVDVSVYFHNVSEKEEVFQLNNYNDEENYHYNAEVDTPTKTNSTYIFRVVASSNGDATGSRSMIVETAPAINGEISSIESSHCDDLQVSEECDPGAELDTEFDITDAGAQGVNMTLYKMNSSSGQWQNHSVVEMNEISASDDVLQTFEGSEKIPDINTSEYDKMVKLEYHAWNQDRNYVENHTIDLKSFVIEDRSNPTAFQSRDHTVRLFLGERFSRDSFNKSRFKELEVNITGPETYNSSYSMDDFQFMENDGTFENTIVIPEEASTGAYELDIMVNDTYGEVKKATKGLQVRSVNATFTAEEELNLEYNSIGEFTETISLESQIDSEKTLDIHNDNENISISDQVTLSPGEQTDFEFDVNITEPGSFETDIVFEDSSAKYNETTKVSVQGPDCELIDGDLCVDKSEINLSVDEPVQTSEEIGITNLGTEEIELNTSIMGSATQAFTVEGNKTVSDFETLDVVFSPESSGTYTGELLIESGDSEVSVDLNGETEFSEVSTGLEADPSRIDMGTLPEGEGYSTELTIENTGEVSVNDISVDTGGLDLEIENFDLSPGESKTLDLSFSNPQSTTITFEGDSSEGELSLEVPTNVEIIEDYSQRTDELRNRMNELRNKTDDPGLESQLSDVSGMINQIESKWETGDYQESKTKFEEAEDTLESVSAQVDTGGSDDPNQSDNSEGGGVPILPIALIFVVLFIIGGFIFYESYIPEEGDPLYGVLGE